MGSCFRPSRLDPATGKRVRNPRYRILWTDEAGARCSEMAYTDKQASLAMLDRKEREVARRREGLAVADVSKRAMPADDLIEAFGRELVSRGSEPKGGYVREMKQTLRMIFRGCGWTALGDIRRDELADWLARQAEAGRAPGTRTRYLACTHGLALWAVEQGWLAEDPLEGMKPPRVGEAGKRRRRRAFTREELLKIVEVAGERRGRVYLIAALSGYRRKELRLMEKRDVSPEGDRPKWHLRAECAKNRSCDVVPVVPDILDLVRRVHASLPLPTSRLLSSPLLQPAVPDHRTLTKDLRRAGICKRDGEGRWADFHSLRYTFCRLMSTVCPIQVVKVLMRHGSINLTVSLYGALGIEEVGENVWNLPSVLK